MIIILAISLFSGPEGSRTRVRWNNLVQIKKKFLNHRFIYKSL